MGEFLLGRTSVPYQLRHSDSATRVHLKMTLDGMTVTAPTGLDDTKLEEALHSKRKWIISNHQEFQRKLAETHMWHSSLMSSPARSSVGVYQPP
jgi:predicted metal-dependent hydrolase